MCHLEPNALQNLGSHVVVLRKLICLSAELMKSQSRLIHALTPAWVGISTFVEHDD